MKGALGLALATAVAAGVFASAAARAGTDPSSVEQRPGFRDALTAPLEDLNLKGGDAPPVLIRAVRSPYDLSGLNRCEAIAAEIGRLDAALGPDLDEAPPPDLRTGLQKAASGAHALAVDQVRDHTRAVLPFRGWIRKLTGAERREKALQKAIRAGSIRRGYLKGVGMRMNCAPPAAPSWFRPIRPRPWWEVWSDAALAWLKANDPRPQAQRR